jgi:N-acetyl-anhydromuramyl-L-alanine amidase AmpD
MTTPSPATLPALPPGASFERVIAHWTAGTHTPSSLDREHYHYIVSGSGVVVPGVSLIPNAYRPARAGYAAHTRGCNSRSIGVAVAAMHGAVEGRTNGDFPITAVQWAAFTNLIARLCRTYKIPVTPQTVLTHAEVQPTLGIAQRGKWDIAVLPFDPKQPRGASLVGARMRREVTERLRPIR